MGLIVLVFVVGMFMLSKGLLFGNIRLLIIYCVG